MDTADETPYRLPGVGIGIEKDTQAFKVITAAKDGSRLGALLGKPESESITDETVAFTTDSKVELDLEVGHLDGLGKSP